MTRIAAFGIGSTNFRYALGTPAGEFTTSIEIEPTRPRELCSQLCEAIESLQERTAEPIDAASICTAGLVDAERGVIKEIDTADGEAVSDLRVRERLRSECGLATYLENDCNAAAIGEYFFGAGDAYDSIVHLTIGTGIGAGIVENGRLLRGEHGHAGEVGLIPVDPEGDRDSFGVPGAWEAYCSGRGMAGHVTELLAEEDRETVLSERGSLTAADVFRAAEEGDPVASEYLDRFARYNAAGLAALSNTCNPGLVTLGGGVVLNNPEVVREGIEAHLEQYCFVEPPALEVTPLGGDVGLYGALGLPRYRREAIDATGATAETTSSTD